MVAILWIFSCRREAFSRPKNGVFLRWSWGGFLRWSWGGFLRCGAPSAAAARPPGLPTAFVRNTVVRLQQFHFLLSEVFIIRGRYAEIHITTQFFNNFRRLLG